MSSKSNSRRRDLVKLLMRYPATIEMIQKASCMWTTPLGSPTSTKRLIYSMLERKFINRVKMADTQRGEKPFIYFLRPSAEQIYEGLKPYSTHARKGRSHCFFRPFKDKHTARHDMAAAQFYAELERSIGESKGKVRFIGFRRDGHFKIKVNLRIRGETKSVLIQPDGTYFLTIEDRPAFLPIEIFRYGSWDLPVESLPHTETPQKKIAGYKSLDKNLRSYAFISQFERMVGRNIEHSTPLFVTAERGHRHLQALMTANYIKSHDFLCRFARLEELRTQNLFMDKAWRLSSGKKVSLLPV